MSIQETESPIISHRLESSDFHYVFCGMSVSCITQLLDGAVCNAVLPGDMKCRLFVSTVTTRQWDVHAMSKGCDVVLALKPKDVKTILKRRMVYDLMPGCRWKSSKDSRQLPAIFAFYNRELVDEQDVIRTTLDRESQRIIR